MIALIAGLSLLVAYAYQRSSTADFGSAAQPAAGPPAAGPPAAGPPAAVSTAAGLQATGRTGPAQSDSAPDSAVVVRDGRATSQVPATGDDAPVRLGVTRIGLDAAVDAVGVDPATGDFAVPQRVDRVGWYRYGPGFTAEAGSIVIAGHVDSAAEGVGALARLTAVARGDIVTLTALTGETRRFTITARETFPKTDIPLDRYFARDGPPHLTLITCGGPFDSRTRHYRDNIVVTATPRTTAPRTTAPRTTAPRTATP